MKEKEEMGEQISDKKENFQSKLKLQQQKKKKYCVPLPHLYSTRKYEKVHHDETVSDKRKQNFQSKLKPLQK